MPEAEVAIGRLTLRPHRQLLENGRTVPLGGKPLAILSVLAEADGGVVTKDELMAAVWPGVIVEENAIQVHVMALRKVLGREAKRLVTVRGRGYLFDGQAPSANGAAIGVPARSVAVLPFANLTGDASRDYLANGIAEELICTLSHASGLKVPARTSSFAYRGRETDIRTIARELGVETVIEGSLRAAGERLRVTAQIIDARSGFHLWSHNYDRESGDLLALQDELAAAIANAFRASLGNVRCPTDDEEAYDLYLKARAYRPWRRRVRARDRSLRAGDRARSGVRAGPGGPCPGNRACRERRRGSARPAKGCASKRREGSRSRSDTVSAPRDDRLSRSV